MNASGPPITTNRAAGTRRCTSAAASMKSSTRFLGSRRPTQPTSTVSFGHVTSSARTAARPRRIELAKVDHRRDLDRMLRALRHPRGRRIADRGADADIAAVKCFGPASASDTRPPCSISGGRRCDSRSSAG